MEDKKELEEKLRVNESLESELEEQELGTHMCCIYRDKEEQLSALSSFMSLGIERNEKCLYVVDDRTKKEVIEAFEELGFDVEKFVGSGQFEFITKSESYLKDGYFDPDEMIELIDKAQKKALDEGYNGLRLTGEMTWVFSDVPGVERLMEYETKLNEFLPDQKVIAMCQYNEEKFAPETLVDVLNTHPTVLIYTELHENSFYMPPEVFKAQQEGKVTREHYESMKEDVIERTRLRSEEKRAKKRLEKEKKRAQKYLDIADVIIVVINKDQKVEEINQRGCEILGYDKEEIIGKNWFKNFLPERISREVIEDSFKALEEGKIEERKRYENPILTKDGEERMISWRNTVLRDDDGEIIAILSSGMDITERKKAEEKFKKLFNASPDPIYLVDQDGVFEEVNEAAAEKLGYEKDEIVGENLLDISFFPPEAKEKIIENFKKRLNGEDFPPYRIKVETKKGKELTAEINAALIEEQGEPVGTIGIARDVTELKKSEERKEFLSTLLRQDLRSKYQTIQGYFQLLEDEADYSGKQKEYLEKSMRAGREADEILDLAKDLKDIEESKSLTEKDIVKIFEHVLENISGLVEEERVEIEENYPEEIGKVEGDYSLKTLFTQLLALRIQTSKCDKIRIEASEREKDLLLKIEDDGKQVSKEIKNLFSGDVYTGETTGAGGVRYYMLREIAEHNDCRIEVKDSELGGARFDVHLKKA
ncbi:MAG: MEDS domain-containing protein [Candidatus Thermoplasmatota archaeon]